MADTPLRNVRVADEVWDAAKVKAQAEGRTLTDVVVKALKRYIRQPPLQR